MGLLSAAGRGARRAVTLADMDKSLVNAASRRGLESDIDPRLILGGSALAMAPVGAGAALAVDARADQDNAEAAQRARVREQEMRNMALRLRMMGYSSRDVSDPHLAAAMAQTEHEAMMPSALQQMLEPGAQTRGLGADAYAGGYKGFYPRDSTR